LQAVSGQLIVDEIDSDAVELSCAAPVTTGWNIWAVTTALACADNLPYGPHAMTDTQLEAYASTCYADTVHTKWLQVIEMGDGTPDMSIEWHFQNGPQTVQERFVTAVTQGVPVNWTVCYDGVTTYKSGLWWWSKRGGDYNTLFVSGAAGLKFSQDDGLFGAGNGEINGDMSNTRQCQTIRNGQLSAPCQLNWAGQATDYWGSGNRDLLDYEQCGKVCFGGGTTPQEAVDCVSKPQNVVRMFVNGYPLCPNSTCVQSIEENDDYQACMRSARTRSRCFDL
jgi:hypothetical protein